MKAKKALFAICSTLAIVAIILLCGYIAKQYETPKTPITAPKITVSYEDVKSAVDNAIAKTTDKLNAIIDSINEK